MPAPVLSSEHCSVNKLFVSESRDRVTCERKFFRAPRLVPHEQSLVGPNENRRKVHPSKVKGPRRAPSGE